MTSGGACERWNSFVMAIKDIEDKYHKIVVVQVACESDGTAPINAQRLRTANAGSFSFQTLVGIAREPISRLP